MSDKIILGDCLSVLEGLPDDCVDSIVTDPPYGISFMGREWDRGIPGVPFWAAALRVAKPGAHLVAFGGTRTYHRLAVAIEDAGWEIRDSLMWLYGTGLPKSHDVLKPAYEPIILARKPLIGTVAANLRAHGTGKLNIDGCRSSGGRWPANLVLDEEAAAALDAQSGTLHSGSGAVKRQTAANRSGNGGAAFGAESRPEGTPMISYGDSGGASRFFYCTKSSRSERTHNGRVDNKHPTVKPLALMRWLVTLITPPGGSVLDPFAGSGSTLVAAELEGFDYLGIEQDPESHRTACERLLAVLEPHPE